MKIFNNILLIITCLLIASCSGTRHLPYGEKLYVGAKIKLKSEEKIDKSLIKSTAEDALRPQPNKSYLGMRPKLMLYNAAGENPKSKFKQWMKKKGEAPVLMSAIKPGVTATIIDAKLFNHGIFKSSTESEILEKKRTGKVVYTSHVHQPFIVNEMIYDIYDDSLSSLILAKKDKSIIKPGEDYMLDRLKNERIRIDAFLKNKGYFYFSPDYLLFKVDTSNLNHSVSFKLTLKDSIPSNALRVYRINNVVVNQNYSLNERGSRNSSDSISYKNIVFLGSEARMHVKPSVISQSIYLRKGEVFSHLNHTKTLNRLMSMGNFKLVQVNFLENEDSVAGLLDVTVLMTPLSKYTFSAEMDVVSKSNNYTGPRLNLSILDRNTFKGGELLNFNLAGTYEAQLGGKDKNLYSYSFTPQLELTFPRFLVPFNLRKSNSIYIPKTSALLSYNYLKKVNYFDIRTFMFVFGYRWKENIKKEHKLNPIDVSYSSIRNKSTEFTELLESNPFLKKSYEEQFIAGGSYSYTYSEQMIPGKKVQLFIQLKSEVAGNALSLASLIGGHSISSENPAKVAGSVYSQFAKLSLDSRIYYNLRSGNKLAMRVFAGVGKPYGNSSVLPYTRQFFSGGPNSIRAFQINSVGPGNYFQDTNTQGFLQMGGDVKLEMNAEYRFNIISYFKGALFVDAGNVWLLKSNSTTAGTPFDFSGFTDQIAVGAGLGLRVDISFFVLRFDLALPMRKPWFEENHRWVTNEIDFSSSIWRKDNLVLNVAIGYPF
ncbi:MAG: BamA/TamA family outer membrane protein [Prolixibacteraceae bacterium]|jgi:outer membrane protein insertion porin family|nr:BamA/TamA family outer membrane protein [Prolixibacteraceae bacterium]